jgi:hypothetical protein
VWFPIHNQNQCTYMSLHTVQNGLKWKMHILPISRIPADIQPGVSVQSGANVGMSADSSTLLAPVMKTRDNHAVN